MAATASVMTFLLLATPVLAAPQNLSQPSPPRVTTGTATSIGPRGAIILGSIDPEGRTLRYWIAFGRKWPSEFHTGVSEERVGGSQPSSVEEVLENLREHTTYKYRLVGIYGHGTKKVFGAQRSFTTK